MEEDYEIIISKSNNLSCCKSYTTPKGRCYTCPEQEEERDPDEETY